MCVYVCLCVCACMCLCVCVCVQKNATVKIIIHFRYCVEDKKRYNNNY